MIGLLPFMGHIPADLVDPNDPNPPGGNPPGPPPDPAAPHIPTFSPVAGSIAGTTVNVTVATSGTGIKMRYTTSGVAPTLTFGILINAVSGVVAVPLSPSSTLKVIAIAADNQVSAVKSGTYQQYVDMPTITPSSHVGVTPYDQAFTIVAVSPSTHIRWTSDGSTPTTSHGNLENDNSVSDSVTVTTTAGVTIKAIAITAANTISPVRSALYEKFQD